MWKNRYGAYDDLARVKEWSATGGLGVRNGERRRVHPAARPPPAGPRVRPDPSVFVSANAGSGKTHVLVQRVIRLLLNDVPPARILCITFTKAAAANMAERVFFNAGSLGHARR